MTDAQNLTATGDAIAMILAAGGTPDAQYETTINSRECPSGQHRHPAKGVSVLRYGTVTFFQLSMPDPDGLMDRDIQVRTWANIEEAQRCVDELTQATEDIKVNGPVDEQEVNALNELFNAAAAAWNAQRIQEEAGNVPPTGWASV
jgi:hypothetical protein